MEIQAATIAQLQRGKGGRMVEIDDDVGGIAKRLREIDPGLHLRYSEAGEYFVVYFVDGEKAELVTTATTCDGRLLQRVERIASDQYDFTGELERLDAQSEADQEHAFREHVGEIGERLAHAIRRDVHGQRVSLRKA